MARIAVAVALACTVGVAVARGGEFGFGELEGGEELASGEFEAGNRKLFIEYCAVCHGRDGKGSGAAASRLAKPPPDLTRLARDNGGEFPLERVMRAIDGRELPNPHRGRDMPLWGEEFAAEYTDPFRDQYGVRVKVRRLAEHVRSIQEPGD